MSEPSGSTRVTPPAKNAKEKSEPPRYVAVTGIDYPSSQDGKYLRVESGEEVLNMRREALEEELRAGNIIIGIVEEVVVPTTENGEEEQA